MEKEKNNQLLMIIALAFFIIGFAVGYVIFYQEEDDNNKDIEFLEERISEEDREDLPESLLEGTVSQINIKEEYIIVSVSRPTELKNESLEIAIDPSKVIFKETLLNVYSINDVRKVAVRSIHFRDIGVGDDVLVSFNEDVLFLIENKKELEAREITLITAEDV